VIIAVVIASAARGNLVLPRASGILVSAAVVRVSSASPGRVAPAERALSRRDPPSAPEGGRIAAAPPASLRCILPTNSTAAPSSAAQMASHSRVVTSNPAFLSGFRSTDQLSRFLCTEDAFLSNECIETSPGKYRCRISANRYPFAKSLSVDRRGRVVSDERDECVSRRPRAVSARGAKTVNARLGVA
jgi:hypothetical protein